MTKKIDQGIASLLREPQPTPKIQKVTPVNSKVNDETAFSFWLPKSKLKSIKSLAIEKEVSIKQIINEALDEYLKEMRK